MSAPYLKLQAVSVIVIIIVTVILGLARLEAGMGDRVATSIHYADVCVHTTALLPEAQQGFFLSLRTTVQYE